MNDEFTFDNKENTQPGDGNNAANAAAAEAIRAASETKRGRGRPRKDGSNSGGTSSTRPAPISPELRAEIARQIEVCYDPKTWGQVLSMPADTALAITGKDRWSISAEERHTLGACGATAARFLVVENPKTLALMMLSSALLSVYLPRCVGQLREMISERKKPVERNDNAAKT